MNAEIVKKRLKNFAEVVSFNYPAVGWYFSSEEIENSFIYKKNRWVCMFMYWAIVMKKEKRIQFSRDCGNACPGIQEFGGFTPPTDDQGIFIAETERFKKNIEISKAYFNEWVTHIHPPKSQYLYMEKLENIDDKMEIEVVNIYPADLTNLTKLVGLSGYDRKANMDNVLTPFASGCQATFSIPYHEQFQDKPKSVIGLSDYLVRKFIPEDMVSFSMPSNRFVEMADNIEGSFLDKNFKNPTGF